jgi:putative ABC transport system permease protein
MVGMAVHYALLMLWREMLRFLPAVLGVGFSILLIILQFGVLMGTISFASVMIDRSRADLFIASRDVPSIDLGYPIPYDWVCRLMLDPEITAIEPYLFSFEYFHKPAGGALVCVVIGTRMEKDSIGAVVGLTPELRDRLTEPMTIVIDEAERGRLGLTRGVGERAEISGQRVRVVGLLRGYKSLGGPFLFCSIQTARAVQSMSRGPTSTNKVSYLVAKVREPERAAETAARLHKEYPGMEVFTRDQFARRTQNYWLRETKAGLALIFTSSLGFLVGLVVTTQTLYAATVASMREYALLRAVGIPRYRIGTLIMAQAGAVGLVGTALGLPLSLALSVLIDNIGGKVLLPAYLLGGSIVATLALVVFSGFLALWSLKEIDPINLLR